MANKTGPRWVLLAAGLLVSLGIFLLPGDWKCSERDASAASVGIFSKSPSGEGGEISREAAQGWLQGLGDFEEEPSLLLRAGVLQWKDLEREERRRRVEEDVRRIFHVFGISHKQPIPDSFLHRVEHYLLEWSQRPELLAQVWSRRQRYWGQIEQTFLAEGLPLELAHVAWVESHFLPDACSRVGARGLWQFMPHTARRFGLKVDLAFNSCPSCECGRIDERLEVEKATGAAAKYLGGLLAEFGSESFMLALAAYNAGEHRIRQILRRHHLRSRAEREFWNLYEQGWLPEETQEYVPRVLAAAVIGAQPAWWGLPEREGNSWRRSEFLPALERVAER